MIDIRRTAFLVDGQTEVQSFRDKFEREYGIAPGLRVVGCNGKNVSPVGYATKAAPIVSVCLRDRFSTVVVIVDHESRRTSPLRFGQQVTQALLRAVEALEPAFLHVFVPYVMFENWIVADIEGIKTSSDLVDQTATQDEFDGRNGASILNRVMLVKYKKTTHARTLFKRVRFTNAQSHSPSFSAFHTTILN